MVPEVAGISYSLPTLQGYEHFLSNILQVAVHSISSPDSPSLDSLMQLQR